MNIYDLSSDPGGRLKAQDRNKKSEGRNSGIKIG